MLKNRPFDVRGEQLFRTFYNSGGNKSSLDCSHVKRPAAHL